MGQRAVLLALSDGTGEGGGRPAEILDRMGATEVRLRELIDRYGLSRMEREVEHPDHVLAGDEVTSIWSNTRWIAAYLRRRLADPGHLLLGALWHEKPDSKVLRELELSFEEAYRQVTGEEPPDELRPPRVVYVSKDDVDRLSVALGDVLPAGVSFGLAYDDEIAWFSAGQVDAEGNDVDLESDIERALAIPR